jgi:Flp pilus assembly protein TadG
MTPPAMPEVAATIRQAVFATFQPPIGGDGALNSGDAMVGLWNRVGRVSRRMSGMRRLRSFARHEKGTSAVEFGIIGLPFLALIFAIMETALVFFAGQALETAASESARKVMTGQAETWDMTKYKQEVCSHIFGLFDCNKIQVNVKAYPSFSSANMDRPVDANGNIVSSFQPGGPGDVVIARLLYDWPTFIPMLGLSEGDRPSGNRLLIATVAFRNEPYK